MARDPFSQGHSACGRCGVSKHSRLSPLRTSLLGSPQPRCPASPPAQYGKSAQQGMAISGSTASYWHHWG